MNYLKYSLIVALIPLFGGCTALNDYDRSLGLVANVNDKTGAIVYTLKPASKKGEGGLSGTITIEGDLSSGKQIISIER